MYQTEGILILKYINTIREKINTILFISNELIVVRSRYSLIKKILQLLLLSNDSIIKSLNVQKYIIKLFLLQST